MNVCFDICYAEPAGNGEQDWLRMDGTAGGITRSFKLILVFPLTDVSAYIAFWTVARTGNFKLRMAAIAMRRLAPIICMTGKDRYQRLHHLSTSHPCLRVI